MAAVVYGDVILGMNFLVDGLLLAMATRCVRREVRLWRLVLAAALGAGFGLWALLPGGRWLRGTLVKLVFSGLLVGISAGFWPAGRFLRAGCWFWFFAFCLGGGMVCMGILSGQEMYFAGAVTVPPWSLGVGLVGVVLMAALTIGRTKRFLMQEKSLGQVWVKLGDREVSLPVLVDSGCDLTEPMTGRPVIIVEAGALREILPPDFENILGEYRGDTQKTAESLAAGGLSCRFRVIPYRALGSREGLLPGFLADGVRLLVNGNRYEPRGCVVALSDLNLSGDGAYRGLVPLYLLEKGKKEGKV